MSKVKANSEGKVGSNANEIGGVAVAFVGARLLHEPTEWEKGVKGSFTPMVGDEDSVYAPIEYKDFNNKMTSGFLVKTKEEKQLWRVM